MKNCTNHTVSRFSLANDNMVKIVKSALLSNLNITHGFTERSGGVSPAPMDSLNTKVSPLVLDKIKNVTTNLASIFDEANPPIKKCALLYLEGGSNVASVDKCDGLMTLYGVDGAATKLKNLALAVTVADCVPILLADKQSGVVGISHAGWKGSAGKITAKVVKQMTRLGAEPSQIMAVIGPGICGKCYEVGPEVAERFDSEYSKSREGGKYGLDLRGVNMAQLRTEGVTQIEDVGICTYENTDRFFSARKEGQTGRFLAYIRG